MYALVNLSQCVRTGARPGRRENGATLPYLCHTLAIMQLQLEKLNISIACVMQHISVLGQLLMTATCCSMCSEKKVCHIRKYE